MKLLAFISRWTKPFRWICSSRVIICMPIVRVVASEKLLELSRGVFTIAGKVLRVNDRATRWPWRYGHVQCRYRNQWVYWCRLTIVRITDALEELIELYFVLELTITFAFFFLDEGIFTNLTAKRCLLSRCSPSWKSEYSCRWIRTNLIRFYQEGGTSW